GISLISEALERAVNRPDLESRSLMMMGSIMGGIAFQKGLGVVHSLAHPLSTLLDVHHGLANAVNLPHGMEFNTEGLEPKFRRIAHALHLGEESGDAVIRYLVELNEAIGVDRKSTRLNSSHVKISYAVFCLKQK